MFFKLLKKNFRVWVVGYVFFNIIDYAFDYALYPFVIYECGFFNGYLIMTFLSALYCLLFLYFYDQFKKDWLGIETVKEIIDIYKNIKKEKNESLMRKIKRILATFIHKNPWANFIFLSIKFDPIITTIYLRRGHHRYDGFTQRDSKIFWASVVFSNLYWAALSFVAVNALKSFIIAYFGL